MSDQTHSGMLWISFVFLLMNAKFRHSEAGDFALIADLENGTIYAGSLGKGLSDISPLPLIGVIRPVAVDYDPVERMVYWSDLGSYPFSRISRAHLDGSNQVAIVDDLNLPDGLALDVEARMIYWTEGNIGYIGRARMDGTGRKEILLEDLDKPRTIITDHDNGHIYWTDWGNSSRIERADLNGSNRMTMVDDGLVWPNGVTKHENYLYWCDASLDKIERSDLLGNGRTVVLDLTKYPTIHPYDLAIYNGYVYWTDWASTTILRVPTNGQVEQGYGPSGFRRAAGIHVEQEPNYCESSPCLNEATCVDIINGFRCQCPAGFQGITCSENPCGSAPCMNGGTCSFASSGFSCQCSDGYDGPTCAIVAHCAISLDPSDVLMVVSGQQAVYLPGDSIQYACPDGYQIRGPATLFCRSDFTWSGLTAICIQEVAQCILVLDPSGVLMVVPPRLAVYVPGNSVTFNCPVGYQLSGSTVRFCQIDSTWSGQPAECIPEGPERTSTGSFFTPSNSCASVPCVNGGSCTSTPDGFTCTCFSGYNGPVCEIVVGCPRPTTSGHVTLVEADTALFPVDEVVTFICDNSYIVKGSTDHSAERVCRSDGTWSGERVECSPNPTTQPELSHVPEIAGGAGGVVLLIVIIGLLVFIKRKGNRNTDDRIVAVPVIENVACADYYYTRPPPYVFEQAHIYEETIFGQSNQPTETSKPSTPSLKQDVNSQPRVYLELND